MLILGGAGDSGSPIRLQALEVSSVIPKRVLSFFVVFFSNFHVCYIRYLRPVPALEERGTRTSSHGLGLKTGGGEASRQNGLIWGCAFDMPWEKTGLSLFYFFIFLFF